MTSSTKLDVHNVSYHNAAKEGPSNGHGQHAHKILFGHMVLEISILADRQTHRLITNYNTPLPYQGSITKRKHNTKI